MSQELFSVPESDPVSLSLSQHEDLTVRRVLLEQIDLDDTRFQYRIATTIADLRPSLAADGQQVPVTLWGVTSPYKIIDGFRRIAALNSLGIRDVNAIVRDDIDEDDAFTLSFIENVKRKNYSRLDKANAIWTAIHRRQMTREDVAREFGLSERQVQRYIELVDLTPVLSRALLEGRLSMAHAVVINRSKVADVEAVVRKVESQRLPVKELRKELLNPRGGRPRRYIVKDGDGFRATAFRYRASLPPRERRRILEALENAASLVRADLAE